MQPYLLFTDSAADLPQHYFNEYDIRIIPMDYLFNGQSTTFYTQEPDREKICEELYTAMRGGADVHTSQITPFRYLDSWKPLLEEGHDILYLAFSSGMSSTYDNAVMAASQLQEDYPGRKLLVVDSLSATSGQGILTVAAAMNRAAGMSIEENAEWIRTHAPFLCHRFTVGDLDYLHKGGRISAAVALIGGMLNIKPLLIIDDEGKLEVTSKVRGVNSAMKTLVRTYKEEMGVEDVPKLVFIGHTALPDKAEALAEMVRAVAGPDTVVETICETPIIGIHTGPEFFSVCGWGFHRKPEK